MEKLLAIRGQTGYQGGGTRATRWPSRVRGPPHPPSPSLGGTEARCMERASGTRDGFPCREASSTYRLPAPGRAWRESAASSGQGSRDGGGCQPPAAPPRPHLTGPSTIFSGGASKRGPRPAPVGGARGPPGRGVSVLGPWASAWPPAGRGVQLRVRGGRSRLSRQVLHVKS